MAIKDKVVVLVTCGTATEAETIARELVGRRLAACVNILESPVRSIYRWDNRVETAPEYLLLIKTSKKLMKSLQQCIEQTHSYDVPELIALPIAAGSPDYLQWLEDAIRIPRRAQRVRKNRIAPTAEQIERMKPLDLLPDEKLPDQAGNSAGEKKEESET
ncbi:MAG: divalent-cation tolerance protein CutA [Candidatus Acidiferrales bacterium]